MDFFFTLGLMFFSYYMGRSFLKNEIDLDERMDKIETCIDVLMKNIISFDNETE